MYSWYFINNEPLLNIISASILLIYSWSFYVLENAKNVFVKKQTFEDLEPSKMDVSIKAFHLCSSVYYTSALD